jgi:hypothetical protein
MRQIQQSRRQQTQRDVDVDVDLRTPAGRSLP